MVIKPPPFKKQEGVGLLEVLVAAAILSLTVGGTILAASRWVKTTSGTSTIKSRMSRRLRATP